MHIGAVLVLQLKPFADQDPPRTGVRQHSVFCPCWTDSNSAAVLDSVQKLVQKLGGDGCLSRPSGLIAIYYFSTLAVLPARWCWDLWEGEQQQLQDSPSDN
jgi:hypothetical protein